MEKKSPRVALITGANSGIGYAIARILAKNGYNVIGVDVNKDQMESLATEFKEEGFQMKPYQCNISEDKEVEKLFKEIEESEDYGKIDVCVNNAAVVSTVPLLAGSPDDWRKILDINVIGLLHCSKLAVNLMLKKNIDDGHIINIASLHCYYYVPDINGHFYRATKYAVRALSEGIRYELVGSKSNIRVTVVCPGATMTNILKNAGYGEDFQKKWLRPEVAIVPEDIANSVFHVLSTPAEVQIQEIHVARSGQVF